MAPLLSNELPVAYKNDDEKRAKVENSLWRWNMAMFILHLFQAVVALAVALSIAKIKAFKIPMTTNFPSWTAGYPAPATQLQAAMPFAAVASGFAFISSAAHLVVLLFFKSRYLPDLQKGVNYFRWYEYALSSSLMIGLIGKLFSAKCFLVIIFQWRNLSV